MRQRHRLRLAIAALTALNCLTGCGKKAPDAPAAPPQALPASARTGPVCATFAAPVQRGRVQSDRLKEMSGLAASRLHPGVLWTHNDRGKTKAWIHALDVAGHHLSSWRLKGVDPLDLEDIAVGPCAAAGPRASRSCVYLGDLGDNKHERDQVRVFRMFEPATVPRPASDGEEPPKDKIGKRQIEALGFRYPAASPEDGPAQAETHPDAEAMAVLPDARIVVITKRQDGTAKVYRVAPDPASEVVATYLGRLDLRVPPGNPLGAKPATGADLSDDGRWLLVRTNTRLWLFDVGDALVGDPARARAALAAVRRWPIEAGNDAQGEAVCWDRAGGVWHTSESLDKQVDVPLWHIPCGAAGRPGDSVAPAGSPSPTGAH